MTVSESERKIDKLKKDNEELRNRLHDLQIDNEGTGEHPVCEEIMELENELANIQKDSVNVGEKFNRVVLVNDQVGGWAKKVFAKFDNADVDDPNDIVKIFDTIANIVCQDLEKRKEEEKDDEGGVDMLNDFATEEFLSKNIRVRPVSGITNHVDDGRCCGREKD